MHYRRMDPQPCTRRIQYWGKLRGRDLWRQGSAYPVMLAPKDMGYAEPWRDRDGTWYWRHDTRPIDDEELC